MQTYRLFYMGAHNHIVGSFEFHAESDADALAIAEQHRDERAAELWCQVRPVMTFAARQGAPPRQDERD